MLSRAVPVSSPEPGPESEEQPGSNTNPATAANDVIFIFVPLANDESMVHGFPWSPVRIYRAAAQEALLSRRRERVRATLAHDAQE
jgi:hypothetical protein